MSTFEPTFFTLAEDISLNDEQQAAQLAFHEVATLKFFDNRLFYNIHEFVTNHLLTWCAEVLTAYQLGCFDDGDNSHEHAKRLLLSHFKQFFVHSTGMSMSLSTMPQQNLKQTQEKTISLKMLMLFLQKYQFSKLNGVWMECMTTY